MNDENTIILSISELNGIKLYIFYILFFFLFLITIFCIYEEFINNSNATNLHINIFLSFLVLFYISYMSYFRKTNRLIVINQDEIIFDNIKLKKEVIKKVEIKIAEYWGMSNSRFLSHFIYNGGGNEITIIDIDDNVFETSFYINSYKMKSQLVDKFRYLKREYLIALKIYHKNKIIEEY